MQPDFLITEQVLDCVGDSVLIHDFNGRILYSNEKACQSSGYTKSELLAMNIQDLKPREYSCLNEPLINVLLTQGECTFESVHRCKNGSIVPVEINSRVSDLAGRKLIVCVIRDITQRKQIAGELYESELKFRALFEQSRDGMILLDSRGKVIGWNAAQEQLTGIKKNECLGDTLWENLEIISINDHYTITSCADYFIELQRLLKTKQSHLLNKSTEMELRSRRGEIYVCLSVLILIEMGDGFMVALMSRDITDRKKVTRALQESEEKYRSLVQNMNLGIFRTSPDAGGHVLAYNRAMKELLGYSRADILDLEVENLYANPGDRDCFIKQLEAGPGKITYETVFNKKDGSRIAVEIVAQPIKNHSGQIIFIDGTLEDVTERRNVEMALQESEEKYRSLVQNIKMGIFRTTSDAEGRILEANKACEEITGYSRNELLNMAVKDLYWDPNDRDVFIMHTFSTPGKIIFETCFKRKNGVKIDVSITAAAIIDKTSQIIYLDGILEDITERRNIERALQQSEAKYHSLVENIKLGIFRTTINAGGKFLETNKAMEEITGYSKEELLKLDVVKLYRSAEERDQHIRQLTLAPERANLSIYINKKDGTSIAVSIISKAVLDKDGNFLYIDGTIEDITERKLLEERIMDLYEKEKKQRQELQEEAVARGMFIDVLAHELRTPLTPIMASTGMLNDCLSSEGGVKAKLALNVYTSAQVLAGRLEELLELARYSRGTFQLLKSPVNLINYLNSVVSRYKPSIDKHGQSLSIEIAADLPVVEIDSSRLEQVIINLLSNASKFSPQNGHISFNAYLRGTELLVQVRDEGIGITPEEIQRIFQPYHRVEQDRLKFPGLGLGLAVAKQIVEAHGGKIWVNSVRDQGSLFCFTIPVKSP